MEDKQKEILQSKIMSIDKMLEKMTYDSGLYKGYKIALEEVLSGKIFEEKKEEESNEDPA